MSEPNQTPLSCVGVCHRVFRRLLSDEVRVLLQLSYVVENIHNPVIDSCQPSYRAQFPSVVLPTAATSSTTLKPLPPKPAMVSPTHATVAANTNNNKKRIALSCSSAPMVAARSTSNAVMTFSQYWELFTNMMTLYGAQAALVQHLQESSGRLTQLLERLQREAEAAEEEGFKKVWEGPRVAADGDGSHATDEVPSPAQTEEEQPPIGEKTSDDLRDALHNDEVFSELSEIINGFFTSSIMKNFLAEHMMYTVNYTNKSAPRMLEIAKLWRWSVGAVAARGSVAASSASALAQLQPSDRETLLKYAPFLDFIYRSFGESGVPADSRVSEVALPEHVSLDAILSNGKTTSGGKRLTGSQSQTELPPIPAGWKGFSTLLMVTATPLSSVRRYLHVARCIVESNAMPSAWGANLQEEFVDVAALRLSEECSLVMNDLAHHDVVNIMALMDDSSSQVDPSITRFRQHDASRVLIHYGRLVKRAGRGRHERLVFLFSDWLCYVEELNNGRMRLRTAMSLDTLRVIDIADDPTMDFLHCFELINVQTKRYMFLANTPEQKQQWVSAIRYAVKQHSQRKLNTHHQQHHSAAGVAVPSASNTPLLMRVSAQPLSANSRLCRQTRYDEEWQDYLDSRPALLHHGDVPPQGAAPQVSSSAEQQLSNTTGSQHMMDVIVHSRTNSTPGPQQRSATHRQLEYDVTPWSRHAHSHRRIRSDDVVGVESSGTNTPLPDSVHSNNNHNHSSTSAPALPLSPSASAALITNGYDSSVARSRAATAVRRVPSIGHALDVGGSIGNFSASTPLRRPVSERFDAAIATPSQSFRRSISSSHMRSPPGGERERGGGGGGGGTADPTRPPLSSAVPTPVDENTAAISGVFVESITLRTEDDDCDSDCRSDSIDDDLELPPATAAQRGSGQEDDDGSTAAVTAFRPRHSSPIAASSALCSACTTPARHADPNATLNESEDTSSPALQEEPSVPNSAQDDTA